MTAVLEHTLNAAASLNIGRLDADDRDPAIIAEEAIQAAMAAVRAGDASVVRMNVEYAKHVLIVRRCGMSIGGASLQAVLESPGLALCSALSNVSEMAEQGMLEGLQPVLAEAAMRARGLVA